MSRDRLTERRAAVLTQRRQLPTSRTAPGNLAQLQAEADKASAASPLREFQQLAAQRMEDEELQMQQAVQRMEEEDLQMKSVAQRMEEDELQMRAEPVQRLEEEEPIQGMAAPAQRVEGEELQMKADAPARSNGLPGPLKQGIESLSGHAMDDVTVHRNSNRPAEVGALAYAQGRDIHLGPGQERHLPHEAWHVVQQAEGRVRPTTEVAGVAINDDAGLEAEADRMGAQAMQHRAAREEPVQRKGHAVGCGCSSCRSVQRKMRIDAAPKTPQPPQTNAIQRTDATLAVNGTQRGNGHAPIGTPNASHAERKSWDAAQDTINAAFTSDDVDEVKITFDITQKVCDSCQTWFDEVVFPALAEKKAANGNKAFELRVNVGDHHVIVLGTGFTPWRDTMADETRLTIAEQMAEYLVAWGGSGVEKGAASVIFIPDGSGNLIEHAAYDHQAGSLDELMINLEAEITAAHERRQKWLETGYHLEGAQRDLDMDAVAEENEAMFGRDRRNAQRGP